MLDPGEGEGDAAMHDRPRDSSLEDTVPGVLRILHPEGEAAPVVFDSPHSGLALPEDFGAAVPPALALRAADAHVDALWASAPGLGAPLLCALFARSYLDVDRSLADIGPLLLAEPGPLTEAAVQARIARCWHPYHEALGGLLDAAQARHGQVWHVDCHATPAVGGGLSPGPAGTVRPDVVLGDLDGASAEAPFAAFVARVFAALGYSVALNARVGGAEILRRHGNPAGGRHSLRIDLDRRLYMDEATGARTGGFDRVAADLATVAAEIIDWAKGRAGQGG